MRRAVEPASRALVQPVAVFGRDNRRDAPARYHAMSGRIGMLYEPQTQTLCTAFCIASDMIATASHCLFQPRDGRLPALEDLNFRIDHNDLILSSGIAGRLTGVAKHNIAVGTTRFSKAPPLSAPKDWAVAKLERPICKFGAIPVVAVPIGKLIAASQQKRIFQLGYHWDYIHWHLAYSGPCRIGRNFQNIEWRYIRQHFANPRHLVLHDCDTGGASSGSPMLMETAKGPVAVAINVGTYTRTRLLLRAGHVVRRLKPDIIANTAVSAHAFEDVVNALAKSRMIRTTDDLKDLQAELQARSLYRGQVDGVFGRRTRAAIRAYQSLHGLAPTGLPSEQLLHQLIIKGMAMRAGHQTVRGIGSRR